MIDFKQKIEEEEKKEKLGPKMSENLDNKDLLSDKKNKWITIYTITIIVLGLIFAGHILTPNFDASNGFMGEIFNSFKHLIPINYKNLNGEKADRINVLLLGIGGQGHNGPYLTDTIMLASFKPSTKQIALISIPRDLVTPVSNWEKINSIDAYAEIKKPGSGGQATAQAISVLLQIPIQYYVRLDFKGFVNIINELGGIKIKVANTLNDYKYPIIGQEDNSNYSARYKHLYIPKGLQTMNGSLALEYTRSRHALGPEGSDFARAHRQQLVLEAIKDKLFSAQALLNPIIITRIIKEFNKNISTNLNIWEMLRIWNIFKGVKHAQITTKVLSDAPDNFLVAGRGQDGAYILTPRSGNFTNIRNFVQNIFSAKKTYPTRTIIPTITDQAKIIVLNGTWISGLAGKTAVLLNQAKFKVLKIANAPTRDYTQTIVYNLSSQNHKKSLEILKKITGAFESFNKPIWLVNYENGRPRLPTNLSNINSNIATKTVTIKNSTPDFLVILGTDANKTK